MDSLNQAKNLIERAQTILILPSQEMSGDILATALALFFTLNKLGKIANIVVDEIPEKFQFLSDWRPRTSNDFVISVDTTGKEISEMRYEKGENVLKVHLALSKGELRANNVSLSTISQKPALLITVGVRELDDLGNFFEQNPRLFYETTILNIDNHPANQNFGHVNLIDVNSYLAEILTNLIKLMESEDNVIFDENIATCLLTGLVSASQNFRNSKTRPQTFETSAYLIEKGGNHQKIIQHLYKQKSVAQINLLGRILEKLGFDEEKELYSASLTEKDFQDSQALPKDLSLVIEELRFNFRYLPNLLILWESHTSSPLIKGVFYTTKTDLIDKILQNYEGTAKGEGILFTAKEKDLALAKQNLLNIL
ncbi:hypothetical protein AMJ47_03835 [Parcubacteria bacterium DG_72]|nr:MAG: hypothetical protein AMJ47_03835 [Parcubacteria bacterium DG_72]